MGTQDGQDRARDGLEEGPGTGPESGPQDGPQDPLDLLRLGDAALDAGELNQARVHFETAERLLAADPSAPDARRAAALRGRAVSHLLAGEVRYASHLLEEGITRLERRTAPDGGPPDPDALLMLYIASIGPYTDLGAYARAAHAAEQALNLAPGAGDPALVAQMHRSIARTLIVAGRTVEAEASLAKAQELFQRLELHTDLAHCHWMRGYVHSQDGDLEQAERELRTARDMLSMRPVRAVHGAGRGGTGGRAAATRQARRGRGAADPAAGRAGPLARRRPRRRRAPAARAAGGGARRPGGR